MKPDIYINYPGHCEKAFQFYEQHFKWEIKYDAASPAAPF